jgi:hypothetical protein
MALTRHIDYYGVTFDHLVPADDPDPKVLQINIIEMDNDGGAYATEHLPFAVNPAEYRGKKVLAVPRCCQKRKGTQDRERVNGSVAERDREMKKRTPMLAKREIATAKQEKENHRLFTSPQTRCGSGIPRD